MKVEKNYWMWPNSNHPPRATECDGENCGGLIQQWRKRAGEARCSGNRKAARIYEKCANELEQEVGTWV